MERELQPQHDWALFLDFDGTLVNIAPHPALVRVPTGIVDTLAQIAAVLDGAVAIVSGRPIADIDGFLPGHRLAVAALHGLETRLEPDGPVLADAQAESLDGVRRRLAPFAARHEGVWLEDKGRTVALHYRARPELGPACRAEIEAALEGNRDLVGLPGKMLIEVKPSHTHKGSALVALMARPPFAGRRPVFAGDDVTDEDAMRAAQALGGIAIKIGAGETVADRRFPDVATFLDWLASIPQALATGR